MDIKDESLCSIALAALRAIQRTAKGRHGDLWQLAIRQIVNTKHQIELSEETPIRAAPLVLNRE